MATKNGHIARSALQRAPAWRMVLPIEQLTRADAMQRRRANSSAITRQQVVMTQLWIAAGLLLPVLLLLLISP